MPRFVMSWILGLGTTAIALVICWIFLSGFHINLSGFIVALIIFAILSAVFTGIVTRSLRKHANSIIALSGLISTFLALLITDLLSSGLQIDGVSTWILATVIIWLISMFIWLIPGPWRNFRKRDGEHAQL